MNGIVKYRVLGRDTPPEWGLAINDVVVVAFISSGDLLGKGFVYLRGGMKGMATMEEINILVYDKKMLSPIW